MECAETGAQGMVESLVILTPEHVKLRKPVVPGMVEFVLENFPVLESETFVPGSLWFDEIVLE